MIHNVNHIKSLKKYLIKTRSFNLPKDEIFNDWVRTEMIYIHDPDTVDYYISLIPLISISVLEGRHMQNGLQ